MRVPSEFVNAADAEIVVRVQTEAIGKIESATKMGEIKVVQKSWLRGLLGM